MVMAVPRVGGGRIVWRRRGPSTHSRPCRWPAQQGPPFRENIECGEDNGEGRAMFRNREDAARQLADKLIGRPLHDPVVLAIPRGGVVTGAVLARELGAELDVVLSRKLRAPRSPELALGAISEDGRVYLSGRTEGLIETLRDYLAQESRHQMGEIARGQKLFRAAHPP